MESPAALVRALRNQLGLTQHQAAARSGGLLSYSYVAGIESGANKLRSKRSREGLARAFGVRLDRLNAYLAGAISLDSIAGDSDIRATGLDSVPREIRAVVFDAIERGTHTEADYEAALQVLADWELRPGTITHNTGRALLDAAHSLRTAGRRVTSTTVQGEATRLALERVEGLARDHEAAKTKYETRQRELENEVRTLLEEGRRQLEESRALRRGIDLRERSKGRAKKRTA